MILVKLKVGIFFFAQNPPVASNLMQSKSQSYYCAYQGHT